MDLALSNGAVEQLPDDRDLYYTEEAQFSLVCMVKMAFFESLPLLACVGLGMIGVVLIRWCYKRQVQKGMEIRNIAALVLVELQARKDTHRDDCGVVVEHLRDSILQGHSMKEKISIWKNVQSLVQSDSRVLEYACFKHGAQVTCWEWSG